MNFYDTWQLHFGDLPAVGHLMRSRLTSRWLRVHSLPNAKRYAEDQNEYAELLHRHNQVATEILGSGHVFVVAHAWGDVEDFRSVFRDIGWACRTGLVDATLTVLSNGEHPDERIVLGNGLLDWAPGSWDDLIRDVADDRVGSLVVYNPRTGEAYAPYDGGADVFVRTSERVAELRDRWRDWQSAHPDGL